MSDSYTGFESRLHKIDHNRTRLARGYSSKVGKDGLIIFKPKRRQMDFPWRPLVFLAVGFFVFKGVIMAHIGATVYQERVTKLSQGTVIEQVGAFVLQADPATQSIAIKLRPFLKK